MTDRGRTVVTAGDSADAGRVPDLGEPEIRITDNELALADEAALYVGAALADAIEARGRADIALTGGTSAVNLYRSLGAIEQGGPDWSRVHLWWGDDRYVPYDHPQSNVGLVTTMLLRLEAHANESGEGDVGTDAEAGRIPGVRVPNDQVHPIPVAEAIRDGHGAAWAAQSYAALLRAQGPDAIDGVPVFDVVLLGLGPDGHILSVFPGSPALAPDAPTVLAVPAPTHLGPHLERVTLNPRILDAARHVVVMVPGGDKAQIVAQVLRGDGDPGALPGLLARRRGAAWFLTRAAAADLRAA